MPKPTLMRASVRRDRLASNVNNNAESNGIVGSRRISFVTASHFLSVGITKKPNAANYTFIGFEDYYQASAPIELGFALIVKEPNHKG